METQKTKSVEDYPDWLARLGIVYVAGMLVYATVGVEFASYFNSETLEILNQLGLTKGGPLQNTWIGGVIEPLMSKLFPLIVIGFLGPVAAASRVVAIALFGGASMSTLRYLDYPVTDDFLRVFFTLGVMVFVLHHLYTEGQQFKFPDEYRRHPWLTGSIFGAVFGLLELHWYVTNMGTELYLRIGPLLMHTLLGGIICGTWIVLSEREEHWKIDAIAWGAVGFAIVFHVVFNSWLVGQDWYRSFWMDVVGLV